MKVFETKLDDAFIIEPSVFTDSRGFFFEGFNQKKLTENIGVDFNVCQLNFSKSSRGVLRGLHFQENPMAQAKLVSVIAGEVWDIAVDLRKDSPNFGKWHGEILSSENKKRFFIPKGFAHGFVTLSEHAELMYAVDNPYSKEHDGGILFNDPTLNIDWKVDEDQVLLSDKDKELPTLDSLK